MTNLKGSEKQIKYAQDILAVLIPSINTVIGYAKRESADNEKMQLLTEKYVAKLAEIENTEEAAVIINNFKSILEERMIKYRELSVIDLFRDEFKNTRANNIIFEAINKEIYNQQDR